MSAGRFMIMHRTSARWERGEIPDPGLIARVGALLGELARAGRLVGAEGLRASSQGARLRRANGVTVVMPGPFAGENELPAGFTIARAASPEEATAFAARQAEALGEVEIDVRPVTEPWDIGMAPGPADAATRRYMALRKATAESEADVPPSAAAQAALERVLDESRRQGVLLVSETLRPSRRGRRYRNSHEGVAVTDGPFTETKELIAGYVIVAADSLDEVDPLARRYLEAVGTDEVDVRELERPS